MNKQFIYLTSILAVAMAASFAVTAQETNVTANNTTLNSTILDNMTAGIKGPTVPNSIPASESDDTAFNNGAESHTAQNLSIMNGKEIVVAPISELAGVAPLVAAGSSSAQAASEPAGSFKIGTGVGGSDPFNPKHAEIESLKLGISIKAMRDTGKMFFVCDIV